MRISACVITKNEEKNLPRWLESMRGVADEMIVVDTGSSDGTVALAKAAGAHVFFFEWVDDFSAAKNFALDHATGDWILFLDADEYFSRDGGRKVRETLLANHGNPEIEGFLFCLVNIDADTGKKLGGRGGKLRCFRNVPWLRYVGRIHEQLQDISGRTGMPGKILQYIPQILVYHTGYTQSLMRQKIHRNLVLLQKLQEDGKARPVDVVYLADCFYGLGEYEDAIDAAREAISRGTEPLGMANRPYTILIQSLLLANHPAAEVREALAAAVRRYPQIAEYRLFWGLFAWDCGEFDAAEEHFRRGFELCHIANLRNVQDAMIEDNSIDLLPSAYFYMGELAHRKKRWEEAAYYFLESLKMDLQNPRTLRFYCQAMLLGDVSAEELGNALDALYNTPEDRKFLHRVLGELAVQEQGDVPRRPFESKIK